MELQEYMAELSKVKTLESAEEKELWKRFKAEKPDLAARQKLIEAYQPLVFREAMTFRGHPQIMDLVQEGTVGLIEAAERYDPTRSVAFSLFAIHRIRGRMLDYLDREGHSGIPCMESAEGGSLLETLSDTAPSVSDQAEQHEIESRLRQAMQRLPQKERTVLEGIYLESHAASEMASIMEVSVSHIYRLQKSGVRRVRGMLSRFLHHW